MKKNKGFTMAEIMIVMTIIGILTAILIPIAFNSAPDENLMKFNKAHNTLDTAIGELISSDEYYLNGDLGIKPDGTLLDWVNKKNYTYFCETLSKVLSTKQVNCSNIYTPDGGSVQIYLNGADNLEGAIEELDRNCRENAKDVGAEIITTDDITYYQAGPNRTFGSTVGETGLSATIRNFGTAGQYKNEIEADSSYKVFCIDVDGINKGATKDNCVDECPFGYGIRVDGKILPGKRAREWLEKNNDK